MTECPLCDLDRAPRNFPPPFGQFLWQIASRAVVPIADITIDRSILGRFYRLIVPHAVSITREADDSWNRLLHQVNDRAMVIILPEGRMRRANGLDRYNKPMSARGGVANILERIDNGQMLMAYSGGLHHVQVPGQRFPHLFRTIRMKFELLDIADYRMELHKSGVKLKTAVKIDLDRRRDLYCPMTPESTRQPSGSTRTAHLTNRRARRRLQRLVRAGRYHLRRATKTS